MFKKTKKLNQKQNQTNGITLVALIITIIVLIILAGVTISIALGENGIFKKSKKAVDEYQKSAKAEEEELDTFYDNLESLDPNSLAAHVKVGDYVEYDPRDGVGDKELKVVVEKGSYDESRGNGDYQNWETIDIDGNPDENLLKSGTTGSGYDETQIFTVPKEETDLDKIKWRVLSIEDGCVNLVSETEIGREGQWKGTSEDRLYLQDITGYAYGPQILDEICNLYGQGTGAKKGKSITVEDVNKITGYDPMNDTEYKEKYGKEHEWTVGEDDARKYKWKDSYYYYKYNEEGMNLKTSKKNCIPYELIFGCKNISSEYMCYWLNSRGIQAGKNSGESFTYFLIRNINEGFVSNFELSEFDSKGGSEFGCEFYPVRPVVTLKSTAKFDANGGDGTEGNPIKFTIEEEK